MFLFMILLVIGLLLLGFTALVISIFGAGALIVFGDVIICIIIIVWIIKKLFFK